MVTIVAKTSPAKGIQSILTAVPEIVADNWKVQTGRLTDNKDANLKAPILLVVNSGGLSGEANVAIDYPKVQIIGRGVPGSGSQEALYQRMDMCKQALVGIPSRPTQWPELTSCVPVGDITDAGYDDSGRPLYTMNFQLIVSYESSGHREA